MSSSAGSRKGPTPEQKRVSALVALLAVRARRERGAGHGPTDALCWWM